MGLPRGSRRRRDAPDLRLAREVVVVSQAHPASTTLHSLDGQHVEQIPTLTGATAVSVLPDGTVFDTTLQGGSGKVYERLPTGATRRLARGGHAPMYGPSGEQATWRFTL